MLDASLKDLLAGGGCYYGKKSGCTRASSKKVEVVLEIASKLKNSGNFINSPESIDIPVDSLSSLAHGFSGLAVFYAVLDQVFPGEEWDHAADVCLRASVDHLETKGSNGPSLLLGVGGVCFAAYLASKNLGRYRSLLSKLDCIFLQEVKRSFLTEARKYIESRERSGVPPELYNLIEGAAGMLVYLLARKNEDWLNKVCLESLETLVALLSIDRLVEEVRVPGWYLPRELQLTPEGKEAYPNGGFNLSYPYGVTGVLAVLSIAAREGLVVSGQMELIQKMAHWIQGKQKISPFGPCWEHSSSLYEEVKPIEGSSSLTRDAWCYGVPAVSRSLWLAATVLEDPDLARKAELLFLGVFNKPDKEWNLIGTSFSYGRAGLLALTYRMAQDTRNPLLADKVVALEEDLLRFYDPAHCFGYRMVSFETDSGAYQWLDSPWLFDGAAGVALTLLLTYCGDRVQWDRAFLTH